MIVNNRIVKHNDLIFEVNKDLKNIIPKWSEAKLEIDVQSRIEYSSEGKNKFVK